MKKIIILCVLFLGIGIVKAKDFNYDFNWKNDDVSIKAVQTLIKVDDGYLVGGYVGAQDAYVAKFNDAGEEIANVYLDGDTVVGLYDWNGYYYAIVDDYWMVSIFKLNKNTLAIESATLTEAETIGWEYVIEYDDNMIYLTTIMYDDFGGMYDYDLDEDQLFMKIDLDEWTYVYEPFEYTDEGDIDFSSYDNTFSKEYGLYIKELDRGRTPLDVTTDGTYNVVVGRNSDDMLSGGYVAVYNKNNSLLKEYNAAASAMYYTDVLITNDYILAVGPNYNNIDVFDFEANLVTSINLGEQYEGTKAFNLYGLAETEGGFTTTYWVCDVRESDGCAYNCITGIINYNIIYDIEIKTDDNGEVKASKVQSNGGELIEFEVIPKEGYVLDSVKVTDKDGNVLVFTDYKFTMPYADVIIEASFKKEIINPNTLTGIATLTLVVVSLITLIITIKNIKKINWIRG